MSKPIHNEQLTELMDSYNQQQDMSPEDDIMDDYEEKYGEYDDYEEEPVFEKTNKRKGLAKFR